MSARREWMRLCGTLQWVRGRITAVMSDTAKGRGGRHVASMGPRSDNRGYGPNYGSNDTLLDASMGPRSDNRGYGERAAVGHLVPVQLQWVRGRITAVMRTAKAQSEAIHVASMGPRSDNRGYGDFWV